MLDEGPEAGDALSRGTTMAKPTATIDLRLWFLAAIVFGTIAFCWPALFNRGPFFHPDTPSYVRGADAGLVAVFGHKSAWSDRLAEAPGPDPETVRKGKAGEPEGGWSRIAPKRTVLSGRSIYYGGLLYAALEILGRWGPPLLQSLLATLTIAIALGAAWGDRMRPGHLAAVFAFLAVLSPWPFYSSMLMPDLFTALTPLAAVALCCFWERLSPSRRIFLLAVAIAGATFHTTHTLIIAALAICAAILIRFRALSLRPALWLLPLILLSAYVADKAFRYGVESAIGTQPVKPPFLTARIIDDGPGYAFLQKNCPSVGFKVCDYLSILPDDSDLFLWSRSPDSAVFNSATQQDKAQLGREDSRFFIAVFKDHPFTVASTMALSIGKQFLAFGYDNFNPARPMANALLGALPTPVRAWAGQTLALQQQMPTSTFRIMAIAGALLSILLLIAAAAKTTIRSRPAICAGLLVIAVIANSAICGAFSKPHMRYQMRIIGLLPVAALILLAGSSLATNSSSQRNRDETGHSNPLL